MQKRKPGHGIYGIGLIVCVIFAVILLLYLVVTVIHHVRGSQMQAAQSGEAVLEEKYIAEWPELQVELLEPNEYSRPQIALEKVNGIVIHYTANAGTTAQQNRDYFNGLAKSHETYASSHFVIGLSGEIIQCIPCSEIAYASNERNSDTIAIECCIPDETGQFNGETYDALVQLTAWLIGRYDLSISDVIRHYDITGKICPKYFVDHEDKWEQFKNDVVQYIMLHGTDKSERDKTTENE